MQAPFLSCARSSMGFVRLAVGINERQITHLIGAQPESYDVF